MYSIEQTYKVNYRMWASGRITFTLNALLNRISNLGDEIDVIMN